MTTIKTTSPWAEAAKMVRKDLKRAFPLTVFNVRSNSYAGGSSISVEWVDGPTYEAVMSLIGKYAYGHFDAMHDIYLVSNFKDMPQVQYVQARRGFSDETMHTIFEWLQKTHAHFDKVSSIDEASKVLLEQWSHWTAREYIYRCFSDKDLTNGLNLNNHE